MSSSNCCFLTCIQVFQEADHVVWYSHLFQNFPVYCDPHSQRLWLVNKAEIDVFLELSCFFDINNVKSWLPKIWIVRILLAYVAFNSSCWPLHRDPCAQLYMTLCDPMDYSPPDSCPWNLVGKNSRVGCCFLCQGIFLPQGSSLHLLHWQASSLPLCCLVRPCT